MAGENNAPTWLFLFAPIQCDTSNARVVFLRGRCYRHRRCHCILFPPSSTKCSCDVHVTLSLSLFLVQYLSLSLSVSASVCLRRDTTSFSFEFSWTITELLFGLGIVLNLVVSFMAVMKAVLWKHIHVDDTGRILWPRLSWRHQSDEKEKDIVDVKQQRNRKEKTQTAQCKAFHFFLIRWNG